MLPGSAKTLPGVRKMVHWACIAESWWFDVWHNVNTGEDDHGNRDYTVNFRYMPTRPGRVRKILRDLNLQNYSDYTFVDFGSGKGRTLLIAAQLPFRFVQGIELREDLHECAVLNLSSCRNLRIQCGHLECLNMDAAEYVFPDGNLVLYFFNPFGKEVMEQLLKSLDVSLERNPRDVFVAMYNPEYAYVADRTPRLLLFKQTEGHRIYRSLF